MCVVSMASDYYNDDKWKRTFPQSPGLPTGPLVPSAPMPTWPPAAPVTLPWTQESLTLLKEVMERMKQLDEKLGLANCEDPKKAAWMKSVEKRVKALERKKRKV